MPAYENQHVRSRLGAILAAIEADPPPGLKRGHPEAMNISDALDEVDIEHYEILVSHRSVSIEVVGTPTALETAGLFLESGARSVNITRVKSRQGEVRPQSTRLVFVSLRKHANAAKKKRARQRT